jgi:hypothetical protein
VGADEEQVSGDESALETSLEELLQRKERRLDDEEIDEEEALIEAMEGRDSPAEPLTVKVIPPQPTEFTCRKCFLLKHQSQLADKKRMLCRDCA